METRRTEIDGNGNVKVEINFDDDGQKKEPIRDIRLTFQNKRKGDLYVCRTRARVSELKSINFVGYKLIDSLVYEKDEDIDMELTLLFF